ncbi:hypothetical protein SCHIN_v1c08810 [Spiroplasma chinense]|uniref:Uncharacterized protein n=1 Tax=Spiroplasma chinense TaxID=216932 RepID=A0A5B9Y5S2_9MOLU|nr:hypothetical protein [Spiroplasma chinense]QEH62076.1 hypothetical protein SCHIN_v1c08810 [Spiroplasma chinense]
MTFWSLLGLLNLSLNSILSSNDNKLNNNINKDNEIGFYERITFMGWSSL